MSGPIFHGGQLDAAIATYGGEKENWLDLSTGINPNPYPITDLPGEIWHRLPDRAAEDALLRVARSYYQVPDGFGIVAANGTQALIELLPKILKSQSIDIVSPTYGEHEHAWLKSGCHVELIDNLEKNSLLANAIVVVNPNNPDAKSYQRETLRDLAKEMAKRHGFLIIDEAFCDADPDISLIPHMENNVLIYRSFGKFFGLAGLRLGFLIGNPTIIHQMENLLGPWCVSGPALELGTRAFTDDVWIKNTRLQLTLSSKKQSELLQQRGFEICGQNPLFTYVDHPAAKDIFKKLLQNQILVRKFPKMATKLRFGLCKNADELARLDHVLANVMTEV